MIRQFMHPWRGQAVAAAARAALVASIIAVITAAVPAAAEPVTDGQAPDVKTVRHVDLERYAGRWHELARIPNRFQRNCAGPATADYALRADGRIDVTNRCRKKSGDVKEATGIARVVDTSTNAKLEVSFVSFLGWRPFWGDYWIIGLDDDYEWVVVGHPEREYGWLLSRTADVDASTLEAMFRIAEEQGYRRESFERAGR